MKKITKAIIAVAGYGTRFLPATKNQPKEMLPIVDKPIIQYLVEEAVASGIKDIILVTRMGQSVMENHFDTHYELEDKLKQALRAVVSWGVRGLVVGGIGGGTAEKAYCDAAVNVRNGSIKTVAELLTELETFVATDQEFHNAFASRRLTNGKLARYYLHALERVAIGHDEPELIPNQDSDQVNLEHILPKNPLEDEWPEFDPEEQSIWVHRLGNMVLLQKGPNDRIGNKPWADKKAVLNESELQLTARAATNAEWGKDEIDEAHAETWERGKTLSEDQVVELVLEIPK